MAVVIHTCDDTRRGPNTSQTESRRRSLGSTFPVVDNEALRAGKLAFIQFLVFLCGVSFIFILYLNYVILKPYFLPLFWASMLSVPLHSCKQRILNFFNTDSHEIMLQIRSMPERAGKLLLGPAYRPVMLFFKVFFEAVTQMRSTITAGAFLKAVWLKKKQGSFSLSASESPVNPEVSKSQPPRSSRRPSTPYFEWLFRCCFLYFLGTHPQILKTFVFLMSTCVALSLCSLLFRLLEAHLLYPLLERFFSIKISQPKVRKKRKKPRRLVLLSARRYSLRILQGFWAAPWVQYLSSRISTAIFQHLHGAVSILVISFFVAAVLLSSGLFAFQIFLEARVFVDSTYSYVNETLTANVGTSTIHSRQLVVQALQEASVTASESLSKYLRIRLQTLEMSPVHVAQLLTLFNDMVGLPADSQTNPAINPILNLCLNSSNSNSSLTSHPNENHPLHLHPHPNSSSAAPPLNLADTSSTTTTTTTGSVTTDAETQTPTQAFDVATLRQVLQWRELNATGRLVRQVLRGNYSALRDRECIRLAASEVRRAVAGTFTSITSSNLRAARDAALSIGAVMLNGMLAGGNLVLVVALGLVARLVYGVGLVLQVLVFFSALYYLLTSEKDLIDYANDVLRQVDPQRLLFDAIEKAIQEVFLCTLKMFLFHALYTWLTFNLFALEFVYISSLLSGFVAMVPVLSPYWIALIGTVQLWYRSHRLSAAVLFLSHYVCAWWVDTAIYSDIPNSHPFITGLSIALGLYAFQLEGLLLGPLLACIPVIVYHLLSHPTFHTL